MVPHLNGRASTFQLVPHLYGRASTYAIWSHTATGMPPLREHSHLNRWVIECNAVLNASRVTSGTVGEGWYTTTLRLRAEDLTLLCTVPTRTQPRTHVLFVSYRFDKSLGPVPEQASPNKTKHSVNTLYNDCLI